MATSPYPHPPPPHKRVVVGQGEMADRIRALDWARTPLGPIESWPDALLYAVNSMLENRFPASILWGAEMIQLYNEAYMPLTAEKHPELLGGSAPQQWAEAWHVIGPQFESVLNEGKTVLQQNVPVPIRRNGIVQDIFWTYSYSPIRDLEGSVRGILVVCYDVTGEIAATRDRDAIAVNLQSVMGSISDGLLVLDKSWRYTYFNEQGAKMLGMRPEQLIGQCVWELFPHAEGTLFFSCYHQAVETGRQVHFEEYYPEPLNLWLECHCYPGPLGLSVYFRDITERKSAEQSIQQSEERFRTLVQLAPVGVAITDVHDGRIRFANEEFARITGYTVAELTRMTSNDLTHPEDRDNNEARYRRLRSAQEEHAVVTKRYLHKSGKIVWARVATRLIHDAHDRTPQVLGTIEDVTEALNVQKATEESEARLAALADSIPTLAWMADKDGWIFWYNRRWYEYTGTVEQDMQGWGWQSVHVPVVLPVVLKRWQEAIRSGIPFEMVFPLRGADGVFRSFLTRILPVRNAQGEVTRWFGTNTEIDALERTRQELLITQERIRLALKNVPLILYTADLDLRYTWINRTHEKFEMAEVIGRHDDEIDPSGGLSELIEFKRSVLERGIEDRREFTFNVKGVLEVYDTVAEPLRAPDGSIVGLTVAAHDITRIRLAEDALRRSEKLAVAGRLAAAISHEINNPLEAVTNLLFLLRSEPTGDNAREYVRLAEEELARVGHIATQSLRFHRQSTRPSLERIVAIVDSAAGIYAPRLKSNSIHVRRDLRDSGEVCCYVSELRQVFGNLIGNAFDALREGGTILLRSRDARHPATGEAGVRILVADSGHGMDPPTLQRIAEPFFTTKGNNGTGLGLWISKDILDKHRATLRVRSRHRGPRTGTAFSIFIPLAAVQRHTAD